MTRGDTAPPLRHHQPVAASTARYALFPPPLRLAVPAVPLTFATAAAPVANDLPHRTVSFAAAHRLQYFSRAANHEPPNVSAVTPSPPLPDPTLPQSAYPTWSPLLTGDRCTHQQHECCTPEQLDCAVRAWVRGTPSNLCGTPSTMRVGNP